jgi:hypothetical protein
MVARPSSPAAVKCRILVRGGAMDYSDEIMIRSTAKLICPPSSGDL